MSDNAEAREAVAWLYEVLPEGGLGGTEEEDRCVQIVLDDWQRIAALPPVAVPEVRPDETLRAALNGLTSDLAAILRALYDDDIPDAVHVDMVRRVARAKVHVDILRAAMAAPAPAPGDEGSETLVPKRLLALLVGADHCEHAGDYCCHDCITQATDHGRALLEAR